MLPPSRSARYCLLYICPRVKVMQDHRHNCDRSFSRVLLPQKLVCTFAHQHFCGSLRVEGEIEATTGHSSVLPGKIGHQPAADTIMNLTPGSLPALISVFVNFIRLTLEALSMKVVFPTESHALFTPGVVEVDMLDSLAMQPYVNLALAVMWHIDPRPAVTDHSQCGG